MEANSKRPSARHHVTCVDVCCGDRVFDVCMYVCMYVCIWFSDSVNLDNDAEAW